MSAGDRELLERSAAGDAGAFADFVQAHQASVHRYLRTMTDREADVEDALQEAFVAAWRAAGDFRGEGSARPWLLTIGRNALMRLHRRRVGEPANFESVEELGRRAGWGRDDGFRTVLDELADRELIERALERLAPDDREILLLRDLEGFSGEEVSALLGLGLPAMKSRLHRARLRLTERLREVARA